VKFQGKHDYSCFGVTVKALTGKAKSSGICLAFPTSKYLEFKNPQSAPSELRHKAFSQ